MILALSGVVSVAAGAHAAPALAAPPGNDNFASATALSVNTTSVGGTTAEATAEANEPAHAGQTATRSVWYTLAPTTGGYYHLDTCSSSLDSTRIAVYTGSTLSGLTGVASNGNSPSTCSSQDAALDVELSAGTTYRIAVDSGAGGSFTLNSTPLDPPANDDFEDAMALSSTVFPNNFEATAETDEPDHGGQAAAHSIWYSLTPATSGYYRVRPCSLNTSTKRVVVYTGTALSNLDEVARGSVADICSPDGGVTFLANAGTTYWVAIDSFNQMRLSVSLTAVSSPPNDDFAESVALSSSGTGIVFGNNQYATPESGEPAHDGSAAKNSVWYSFAPTISGRYGARNCGSGGNLTTRLGIYSGESLATLDEIASAADTGICPNAPRVEFDAVAGATYWIAIDTRSGGNEGGQFTLTMLVVELDSDEDGVGDDSDQCDLVPGPAPTGCPDADGDGVPDDADLCDARDGPGPDGCPSISRTLALRYAGKKKAFKGVLGPSGPCAGLERVTVFKKRPGPDRRIGSDLTDASGRYLVPRRRRPGRYYATAAAHLEPSQGNCGAAQSPTRRLRRLRRR